MENIKEIIQYLIFGNYSNNQMIFRKRMISFCAKIDDKKKAKVNLVITAFITRFIPGFFFIYKLSVFFFFFF